MARVLMVASEAVPFFKSGGLADVVTSLSAALRSLGHEVIVLLPRYGSLDLGRARRIADQRPVLLGPHRYDTSIWGIEGDVPFYFVDCPVLYARPGLYGESGADYSDNHLRFAVLARTALEAVRSMFRPDVIHCHDWQAGLVPTFLRSGSHSDPTLLGIKTLFTIHNLAYQGLFPRSALEEVGLDESVFHLSGIEFYGRVSFIKGGLNYADLLNTVSPTYAREIQTPEFGCGLDGLLRAREEDVTGILNGVDYSKWSPEVDPFIPTRYTKDDLSGKRLCKEHLIQEYGLHEDASDRPVIGIVSRLTAQKGIDIVADVLGQIVAENMYMVVLGMADRESEGFIQRMATEYPGRVSVRISFEEGLAHRIEAGADIFLMPSRYEPCGLNQMFSLRYGTVPVVRSTGGLADTVDSSTGFKFHEYSGAAMLEALRAANELFSNRSRWEEMMRNGMAKDFSWRASATAYESLYQRLIAPSHH